MKYICRKCKNEPCTLEPTGDDDLPVSCPYSRWDAPWSRAEEPGCRDIISAAIKTLNENRHLCDGDDCTLRELRDAVERENLG